MSQHPRELQLAAPKDYDLWAGPFGTNALVRFRSLRHTVAEPSIEGVALIGELQMSLVTKFLAAIRRDEDGQGLAEYALILALIAIVAIVALIFLGGQVSTILSKVGTSV
jgi:pilus assembly protein Flp/PilA